MYNPEDALIIKRSSSQAPLSKAMQEVYDLFLSGEGGQEQVLLERTQADLEEYKKIYAHFKEKDLRAFRTSAKTIEEMVNRDKTKVEALRDSEGQKDTTERGKLFESMMFDFGKKEDRQSLIVSPGDGTSLFRTTEFDDRQNQVDGVLELSEITKNKVAIDFTTSTSEKLNTKLYAITDKLIGKNRLAEVKYYNSENGESGPIKDIPTVVIAVEDDMLDELCQAYLEGGDSLAKHSFQVYLFKAIESQLSFQSDLLEIAIEKTDINSKEVFMKKRLKKIIDNTLIDVEKILDNKKTLPDEVWKRVEDEIKKSKFFDKIFDQKI
ncbi:hypothetical protein C0584_02230 [Candidatus Parcubacteria bacterium]|nr:MAG: hypothetical protein C0584_02230 [Candidatus Parcubacteria bacterium]